MITIAVKFTFVIIGMACIGCQSELEGQSNSKAPGSSENSTSQKAERKETVARSNVSANSEVVSFSSAAAAKIIQIMSANNLSANTHLRISTSPGVGKSRIYALGFVDKVDPTIDLQYESNGIKMLVEKASVAYLQGTVIDFESSGPDGSGFRFNNPNAEKE